MGNRRDTDPGLDAQTMRDAPRVAAPPAEGRTRVARPAAKASQQTRIEQAPPQAQAQAQSRPGAPPSERKRRPSGERPPSNRTKRKKKRKKKKPARKGYTMDDANREIQLFGVELADFLYCWGLEVAGVASKVKSKFKGKGGKKKRRKKKKRKKKKAGGEGMQDRLVESDLDRSGAKKWQQFSKSDSSHLPPDR